MTESTHDGGGAPRIRSYLRLALLLLLGLAVWRLGLLRYATWDAIAARMRAFLFAPGVLVGLLLGLAQSLGLWASALVVGLGLGVALYRVDRRNLADAARRREAVGHALINIFITALTALPLPLLCLFIALAVQGHAGLGIAGLEARWIWLLWPLLGGLWVAAAIASRLGQASLGLATSEAEPSLGAVLRRVAPGLPALSLRLLLYTAVLGIVWRTGLVGAGLTLGLEREDGLMALLSALVLHLIAALALQRLLRALLRRAGVEFEGGAYYLPPAL